MERLALRFLQNWLSSSDRKPLVIRGARQVGKTWLVKFFAEQCKKSLIEINLEKQPQLASLFVQNDTRQILFNLSAKFNREINPKECILFIDEIQEAPELLSKLRWFAEELTELPVITTGSLLEFVLKDHTFSMPVGRINYMHLEPMSFEEFLLAKEKQFLLSYLTNYRWNFEIPIAIHEELTYLFIEYSVVGGLPAAVSSWINEHSLKKVNQIHHDLLATYRDDFPKYRGRLAIERLYETMNAIPKLLSQKIKYTNINPTQQAESIKQALYLLNKARICHRVTSTAANGVPLGAEMNEKYFKEIFIDIGLTNAALGLTLDFIQSTKDITLINKGAIAEQVTGQILRTISDAYIEPELYYWLREEKTTGGAEIDYVIQHGNQVIPIEVKAGSTGSLKSLHLFMALKNYPRAIRVNSEAPSKTNVTVKTTKENSIQYILFSLPFYLIGQIHRLLDVE